MAMSKGKPLAAFFLALFFGGSALACPLCFSGTVITPGQKLDSADQAVLAIPAGEAGKFRIVAVVKGVVNVNETIVDPSSSATAIGPLTAGASGDAPEMRSATDRPLLLVRNELTEQWSSIGAIDIAFADWLRKVAATNRGGEAVPVRTWPQTTLSWSTLSDDDWRDRLILVAPHFESDEPLAAEVAYGELARAPYAAMSVLKPQLDAPSIVGWVGDPSLGKRRAAYTLLLGFAGGPAEAAALEREIDAALAEGDTANLAPMLAADLELRGADRVDWIEAAFFADHRRSLPEIDAALLALSVHGGADGVVSRQRVVEAYRFFIHERAPMAGFVARDLADWKAWGLTADYLDLIRTNAIKDPAGRFAIVNYILESPDAKAQAAVEALVGTTN
jgi:hypothetical protein